MKPGELERYLGINHEVAEALLYAAFHGRYIRPGQPAIEFTDDSFMVDANWGAKELAKIKEEKDDRDIGDITELAHDLHKREKKK